MLVRFKRVNFFLMKLIFLHIRVGRIFHADPSLVHHGVTPFSSNMNTFHIDEVMDTHRSLFLVCKSEANSIESARKIWDLVFKKKRLYFTWRIVNNLNMAGYDSNIIDFYPNVPLPSTKAKIENFRRTKCSDYFPTLISFIM